MDSKSRAFLAKIETTEGTDAAPVVGTDDLYTMTEVNYEKYKECAEGEQESFVYLADLSDPNTAGANLEVDIDAGTYVTVIDNTDCGEAQPPDQGGLFSSDENDRARVDYRITAQ